jgi:hypothetical protein
MPSSCGDANLRERHEVKGSAGPRMASRYARLVRLLFDTNVLVAPLVARGTCHELLEHCVREHLVVSLQPLLDELSDALPAAARRILSSPRTCRVRPHRRDADSNELDLLSLVTGVARRPQRLDALAAAAMRRAE